MNKLPFQPAPDVCRVNMVYFDGNSYLENVLHYKFAQGFDSDDMHLLGHSIATWFDADMNNMCTPNLALVKIIVTDLSTETSPGIEFVEGLPIYGTANDSPAPANVTLAVKFTTGKRGRCYRGRVYQVGISVTSFTNSIMSTSLRDYYKLYWLNLLSINITSNDTGFGVLSKWVNKTYRSQGLFNKTTGVEVDLVADSQRRRLPGRGR